MGDSGNHLEVVPVDRAVFSEVAEGRGTPSGGVLYDMRPMAPEVATSYTQIRPVLKALDLPSTDALVEVAPAQHYLMGGIRTDEQTTAGVPGLFAVGEVAGGAHGAHRLATCGGTEVIATGAIAGQAAARYAKEASAKTRSTDRRPMPERLEETTNHADAARLEGVRAALETGCGVLRERGQLEKTLLIRNTLGSELEREERLKTYVGHAVLVASAIAHSAMFQKRAAATISEPISPTAMIVDGSATSSPHSRPMAEAWSFLTSHSDGSRRQSPRARRLQPHRSKEPHDWDGAAPVHDPSANQLVTHRYDPDRRG